MVSHLIMRPSPMGRWTRIRVVNGLALGALACLFLFGCHSALNHRRRALLSRTTATPELARPASSAALGPVAEPPRRLNAEVWWFAPFLDQSSFGVEASAFVLSLRRLGLVDVNKLHVGLLQDDCVDQQVGLMDELDHTQLLELRWTPPQPAIVVCHNLPPFMGRPTPRWRSCEPCPPPSAPGLVRCAVARSMAETSRIPPDFVRALNSLDEVWVPTEASAEVLRTSGVIRPMRIVPLSVDTEELDRVRVRPLLLPPPNAVQVFGPPMMGKSTFNFISVFKWELRKGYDVLLRAFLEEFGQVAHGHDPRVAVGMAADESDGEEEVDGLQAEVHAGDGGGTGEGATAPRRAGAAGSGPAACHEPQVALYILTKPFLSAGSGASVEERLRHWARGALGPEADLDRGPRVYLVNGHVSRKDYVAMVAAADAFVLPTRGEGWGLPVVEAMALGLPVIATNWSGPTAYLDEQVGYPLSYSLTDVPSTEPYWFQGSQWAEPALPHLRSLLRRVSSCSGRADAKARGEAARQRVLQRYAQPVVARQVARELQRIADAPRGSQSPTQADRDRMHDRGMAAGRYTG